MFCILDLLNISVLVVRVVITKQQVQKGADPVHLSFIAQFIASSGMVLVSLVYHASYQINWQELAIAAAGGAISNIATVSQSYAQTRGKGGPATALVETSPAIQTVLTFFILDQGVNFMQAGGLILSFLSAILVIFGDTLMKKAKALCGKDEQELQSEGTFKQLPE